MVVIDNVDSLKQWLVKKLSPVCDADPNALAKYVIALVRKDKSDEDLKSLCHEQLEVFLQKETGPFVDSLFEILKSRTYGNNQPDSTTESRPSVQEVKEKPKESRSHKQVSKSPTRSRQRSPESGRRRHYEDRERRHRRRSPVSESRRHFGRRPRSRSLSPQRRSTRTQDSLQRRLQRMASPKRSRSPRRRRSKSVSRSRSVSPEKRGSHSERSSSAEPSTAKPVTAQSKKKERCWDYDQQGFCMKGDQCPYDHGDDAVVVEDLTITTPAGDASDGKKKTAEESKLPTLPATINIPPPALPRLPLPLPVPPPPVMHHPIPVPPPNLLHRFPPPININIPPPNFIHRTVLPPSTAPAYNPEAPALNINKQEGPSLTTDASRKRTAAEGAGGEPAIKRTFTNHNPNSGNKTLIVKKIPPMLNNIAKLNEHFAKFGAINNIQVKYEFQANQALVEFAHPSSARAAMRDTEAVLNNRFIRVFWYNAAVAAANEGQNQKDATNGNAAPSVRDRIGTLPTPNQLKYTAPSLDQNTKVTVSGGGIQRTIANPEAKEAADKPETQASEELKANKEESKKKLLAARHSARQKVIQQKSLALKKKYELTKKRQGLLQKQIEQQKLLLGKLDSKTLQPNEKAELMKTLKILTASIDSIRNAAKVATKPATDHVPREKQKQTQKELLDAELDLFNASTNGENTAMLKKKLSQLKVEANSLGLVSAFRGSWRGRGRGTARGRGGRGRATNVHRFIKAGANIDRRPCEIRISGFQGDEKDEMITHFAEFGEIQTFTFDDEEATCTIKYKTRHDAEQAASQGSAFKNRSLIIVWTSQPNKLPAAVAQATSIPPQGQSLSPAHLQEAKDKSDKDRNDDDDDEEDEISVVVDPVAAYTPPEEQEEYGYGGLLEEELDEEALLAGADLEDEEDIQDEERSWKH